MHEDEREQLSFTPLDHHKVTHTPHNISQKYILHLTIQKEQAVIKLLADTTIKYRECDKMSGSFSQIRVIKNFIQKLYYTGFLCRVRAKLCF